MLGPVTRQVQAGQPTVDVLWEKGQSDLLYVFKCNLFLCCQSAQCLSFLLVTLG